MSTQSSMAPMARSGFQPRYLAQPAAIACAYYAAGKLAVLMAIPPGYATPVWPAAGVALAGVLLWGNHVWPGIVLGSFFVNVFTSLDTSGPAATLRSLALPAIIAGGAALQAVAGASLIWRATGRRPRLEAECDLIRLLLLGGPLSCLVSPSVGVTTLLALGSIRPSQYLFNWSTWWVGDVIGVLIFTPLVLIWADAQDRRRWPRPLLVTVPLCLAFACAVAVFILARQSEQRGLTAAFDQRSETVSQEFRQTLERDQDLVIALGSFFSTAAPVDRDRFQRFAHPLLPVTPGVQALEWIPRIPVRERAQAETAARRAGYAHFRFTEHSDEHALTPAASRAEYFPVYLVAPDRGNEQAVGYDVGSEPMRRQALLEARDVGRPVASRPIVLVQETRPRFAFLLFQAVYAVGAPHETVGQRRTALRGYALGVFRTADVMEAALSDADRQDFDIRLYDQAADGHRLVWDSRRRVDPSDPARTSGDEVSGGAPAAFRRALPFAWAGRAWTLELRPSDRYLAAHRSWQAWTVLAAGLLFTGLLGLLLLVLTGRTASVEDLVTQRTAELRAAQTELERSNADLSQFAYVASHDLQEPLRMVASYVQLLGRRYQGRLDADADQFIAYAVEGVGRMQDLIGDLLAFSRVGTRGQEFGPVDADAVLDRALMNLQAVIDERAAVITHDPLPTVVADGHQLVQVFQNLLSNGIKFQQSPRPTVHVSAAHRGKAWVFSVCDAGIGIPAEYRDRIFEVFQRLHTREEYPGTGIGLPICKKIIERHGGRIWFESEPGRGSTFFFTIPDRESGG